MTMEAGAAGAAGASAGAAGAAGAQDATPLKRARRCFKAEEVDSAVSRVLKAFVPEQDLSVMFAELNQSLGSTVFAESGGQQGAAARARKRKATWAPSKPLCARYILEALFVALQNEASPSKICSFDKTKVLNTKIIDLVMLRDRFLLDERLVQWGELTSTQLAKENASVLRTILGQLLGGILECVVEYARRWAQSQEITLQQKQEMLAPLRSSKGKGLVFPSDSEVHVRRAVHELRQSVEADLELRCKGQRTESTPMDGYNMKEFSLVPSFVSGPLSRRLGWVGVIGTLFHVGLWLSALILDILLLSSTNSAQQATLHDLKSTSLGFFGTGFGLVVTFTLLHLTNIYKIMPGGGPPVLLAAITGANMVSTALDFLSINAVGNEAESYWPQVTGPLTQEQQDEYASSRILLIWAFVFKLLISKVLQTNIDYNPVD